MKPMPCVWVLGLLTATNAVLAQPSLRSPGEIAAGARFEVTVEHPGLGRDFLTITAPEALDAVATTPPVYIGGEYGAAAIANASIARTLIAPDRPGAYEVRYVATRDGREVVARQAISVTDVATSLVAPATAVAGAWVPITWRGPGNQGDVVSITPQGQPDDRQVFQSWAYARGGSGGTLVLNAVTAPGKYEVRYYTASTKQVLARAPLEISKQSGAIKTSPKAMAGARIKLALPGVPKDAARVGIYPINNPTQASAAAEFRPGSPQVELDVPEATGTFEVRVMTADTKKVLAVAPLELTPASATVKAPTSVVAGSDFDVAWTGPGNPRDTLAIRREASDARSDSTASQVAGGSRVRLRAPAVAGDMTVCYVAHQSRNCVASARVKVLPQPETNTADAEHDERPNPGRKARQKIAAMLEDDSGDFE